MKSPVARILAIETAGATVEVARTSACARCAKGRGCGAGLLGGTNRYAVLRVALPPASDLREGDFVHLALEPSHLLRASMLVYGLPLAGMLLALSTAWLVNGPLDDPAAIACAVVGLAAGVLAGRWRLGRRACLQQFVPVIEGRANAAAESF